MAELGQRQELFGLDMGWDSSQWTASDDRVRGGQSQSFLHCTADGAQFHGVLDIKALGGAGFASQRTLDDDRPPPRWDLSSYNGIEISLNSSQSDLKVYTLTLKDHVLPPDPGTGREQATTSWEYEFSSEDGEANASTELSKLNLFIPWSDFKPTYRGKPSNDTKELDLSKITRIGIMIRRFVGCPT